MNIGIDIDDTISKSCEQTDICAKEYTENVLRRKFEFMKIEINDPMWCKHLYGWNDEEDKKFWELYYEKIVENVKPKEDAIEVINRLSKNNNIILITARWDKEDGIISRKTIEWLQKYGINYSKIYVGYENKEKVVKDNNIDVFIDDSYKTCKKISEMNVRTLIMNSRINKDIEDKDLERVFSWREIEDKIKE